VLAQNIKIAGFDDGILSLEFETANDSETFKKAAGAPGHLRQAIQEILGINPQFRATVAEGTAKAGQSLPSIPAAAPSLPAAAPSLPAPAPAPELLAVPQMPEPPAPLDVTPPVQAAPAPSAGKVGRVHQGATYGEPLLREILGAKP
jgi:hypothetical protein